MAKTHIVVMGVSASGKTTFGEALAAKRSMDCVDGDSLHSKEEIAKMKSGEALTDEERAPWLDSVGAVLADEKTYPNGVIVPCSALKLAYRDRLRALDPEVGFIYLQVDRALVVERFKSRKGHFMPAKLIDSQFETLEPPTAAETDVLVLDGDRPIEDLVAEALDW